MGHEGRSFHGVFTRGSILVAAGCLVVALSTARAQVDSWDERAPADGAQAEQPDGPPAVPDSGKGSPLETLPENAALPAAAPEPTVCMEIRKPNERTPERVCRPGGEPDVCTVEFDDKKPCKKVSCPGATAPDPDGTLESPCCGPGFAFVSLTRSKSGETTVECCPAERVCGPLPRPAGPMRCEPNPVNCNTQPGSRRQCPSGTTLTDFQVAGSGSQLLCCRQGEACKIFVPGKN
jgi:hypothetical protein